MQTRRDFLLGTSAACLAGPAFLRGAAAPAGPVSVARCKTYDPAEVLPTLQKMFDQLGGLGSLVKNKTVAMKINLTGAPTYRLGYLPLEDTHYTHPNVIAATAHLLSQAGARRIRILESPWSTADPVEEYLLQANWEPRDILRAAPNVEFENTNYLGQAKKYSRMLVPFGGYVYPAFDLNHSYEDCDVFVSVAKLKEHATAGVTLSMKNCFGLTPCTIYGTGAGKDEPALVPKGGRTPIHSGNRQPSASAPPEKDPKAPRQDGWRVPRTVVDLVAARPIHLAIIDGIRTMTGGEGPWIREEQLAVAPGVMVAGLNPINTDAVAMSVMGFDPMADRGTPPFERCDSIVKLAEEVGIGTRDLARIDLRGTPIAQARFDFAAIRQKRRSAPLPAAGIRG
ncbi:MAG TPA: DUF362 domain-containing protein [Candidatus Sulfopaludibacter sp.]|jgi:uncharacterized protein (DUF362 family)|nr:DUF362 domain-containing protein [Candidatus Sulfopaludibacter sp.]